MVSNAPECRTDIVSQAQDKPQTTSNRRYRFSFLHPYARLRSLDTSQTETRIGRGYSGNEQRADVKTRITTNTTTIKYPHKCKIITFKMSKLLHANAGRQSQTAHYRLHPHSCQLIVITYPMTCVINKCGQRRALKETKRTFSTNFPFLNFL